MVISMEERRKINRIEYSSKGVLVLTGSQEKYMIETDNVSPLGMAVRMKEDVSDIVGQDAIVITSTMIMYVKVMRKEALNQEEFLLGVQATNFTDQVLQYLFESIGKCTED